MKSIDTPPTDNDWSSEFTGLGGEYARNHFNGLTIAEAETLILQNSSPYIEDFVSMPTACFQFYIHALLNVATTEGARGDFCIPDYFCYVVQSWQDTINADQAIHKRVLEILSFMEENPAFYDSCIDILPDIQKTKDMLLGTM